jgi:methionyl-tRNA formyltransferase
VFKAVVCAYSEVGYRCLAALLDAGADVPLVFTHSDAPGEERWFGSVHQLARTRGVPTVTVEDPHTTAWSERIAALAPQYLLSFYYRSLLEERLLRLPRWGALNMHGSLLPKYRGRAPVNWALVNGERQTGATLHFMVAKPDAGPIVSQEAVAIGINDTALTVSLAVAAAAARLVARCMATLAAGPPAGEAMDLSRGSYYGGRKPEDGRIDLGWPALAIHNLIRAVAPPFPGAFVELGARRVLFEGSRWTDEPARHAALAPCLYAEAGSLYLDCGDGRRLAVVGVRIGDERVDAEVLTRRYGRAPLPLAPHAEGRVEDEETAHSRG